MFNEAPFPHRDSELDLVSTDECELGRAGLVIFDRNVPFGDAVGCDHAGTPMRKPSVGALGTAAKVETLSLATAVRSWARLKR